MSAAVQAVLVAVAHRAESEPDYVVPTLRLLADLDALPDADDTETIGLARRLNAERLTARRDQFPRPRFGTTEVRTILGGVTRQAFVASRVANKSLLALRGRRPAAIPGLAVRRRRPGAWALGGYRRADRARPRRTRR